MVASFVLGSKASSTGTRPPHHSAARTDLVVLIRRTVRARGDASTLHSLRPCLGQGASWRAGVGRVRRLNFSSILRESSPLVPNVSAIEVLLCRNGFPAAR